MATEKRGWLKRVFLGKNDEEASAEDVAGGNGSPRGQVSEQVSHAFEDLMARYDRLVQEQRGGNAGAPVLATSESGTL